MCLKKVSRLFLLIDIKRYGVKENMKDYKYNFGVHKRECITDRKF